MRRSSRVLVLAIFSIVFIGLQAAGRVALAGLALFWLFEVGRAYPDNLAFFNTSIGGPANGYKYLSDSNVDWGQSLKPLKAWMDRRGVSCINLAYFGSADPAYYHIICTYLPDVPSFAPKASDGPPQLPGYVAIGATELAGASPEQRDFYAPFRDRAPAAIIGDSMFVYWADGPWWQSDEAPIH